MKYILQTFKIDNAIKFYEKVYKFTDPINFKNNLNAGRKYSESVMKFLEYDLDQRNMKFGYPRLNIIKKSSISLKNKKSTISLTDFMQ